MGEFYKEAGVYKTKQASAFTDIRKYAQSKGLQLISHIGGTPDNTANPLYPLDLKYRNTDGDYVPLPTTGASMTSFQNNFVEWALNADKALGATYHSIWIGHQEPTHTLGFIDYPTQSLEAKQLNIRRFIDYWKPIASKLRAAGCKVGGIQLPSGANSMYQYAVDYLKQQNVQLDFITHQFYQWGDKADFDAAIKALESYRLQYPSAKLFVVRGHWYKVCCDLDRNEAITTSKGMIWYLKGERFYMDKANLIHGHMYDNNDSDLNKMQFKIHTWLNSGLPIKRRPLSGLPTGMDGFVLSSNGRTSAVVWNTGTTTQTIALKLNNATSPATAKLTIQKASGTSFTNMSSVTWNATTKTIGNFTVATDEIVLINLQ